MTQANLHTHTYKRCGEVRQPLDVVIDSPLRYHDVPLIYADGIAGLGTGASVDLVPSTDSTILSFRMNSTRLWMKQGEKVAEAVAIGVNWYSNIHN